MIGEEPKIKNLIPEVKEEIRETIEKEPVVSENFEIYRDKKTKEFLEPGDEKKFDEVKEFVEGILGSKWRLAEKISVYLFSDEKEYYNFLDKKFPENPKDSATFDKQTNSIANLTPIPKTEEIDKDLLKKTLEKEGVSEEQLRDIYLANILSGVGHEFSHLHPFFGGVGNKESENKWEQEMVCTFVGEKIRTKFGNERFRNYQFKKAQEELKQLQKQNKNFLWEKAGENWEKFTDIEHFVYPWLEKKHGIEKLQDLWGQLFKDKRSLPEAVGDIYGTNLEDLEKDFEKDMLKAENYKEIETK
jgi:hypothetical protein